MKLKLEINELKDDIGNDKNFKRSHLNNVKKQKSNYFESN